MIQIISKEDHTVNGHERRGKSLKGLPPGTALSNIKGQLVILGAGASRACIPSGDAEGRIVPLMADFVDVVDLRSELTAAGLQRMRNIERIASKLVARRENDILARIDNKIRQYFAKLRLPDSLTTYDHLVTSLRSKDLIATFNWDPLLLQAYRRSRLLRDQLPTLAFLHGCVSQGVCRQCSELGTLPDRCPQCGRPLETTPVLLPVAEKNYEEHDVIRDAWERTRAAMSDALVVTVFGYGAPRTDRAAVKLLRAAAMSADYELREQRQLEIVDTAPVDVIQERWSRFFTRSHYTIVPALQNTLLGRFPRRACEGLIAATAFLDPWPDMPPIRDFDGLRGRSKSLIEQE